MEKPPSQRKSPPPPRKKAAVEKPSKQKKTLSTLCAIDESSIPTSLRSRDSPPTKRAPHKDLMGAACSQEQVETSGQEVIDLSEVAAAATTSVYHSQYGVGDVPSPAPGTC